MDLRDSQHVEANPLAVRDTARVMGSVERYEPSDTTIAGSRTDDTTGRVGSKRDMCPDGVVRHQGVDVHLGDVAYMMSPTSGPRRRLPSTRCARPQNT
jgi:hypothetical protein